MPRFWLEIDIFESDGIGERLRDWTDQASGALLTPTGDSLLHL